MMHGSKRNEIVLFKANADLAQTVTYFIPEVFLWKIIFYFIWKHRICSKVKIFGFIIILKILVIMSNRSRLFGGWRNPSSGFGIKKKSLHRRRWKSNPTKGNNLNNSHSNTVHQIFIDKFTPSDFLLTPFWPSENAFWKFNPKRFRIFSPKFLTMNLLEAFCWQINLDRCLSSPGRNLKKKHIWTH